MADNSFFIVIEGMDGSGKTGITRHLHSVLSQTHHQHVALTFEPHDPSAAGLFIRNVLTKRIKVTSVVLALAFALNRSDHNARIIDPFLSSKHPRIMISDRYTLSSLVYQSTGGLSMDDVYNINQWARRPDLTIFLNVSPQNCYARMRNRPQDKELFEKNLQERADKYQAGIQLLRDKGETVIEVDANPPFLDVLTGVLNAVQSYAPDWMKIQPPLFIDESTSVEGDLAFTKDDDLNEWVQTLNAKHIDSLTYADVNQLFKAYIMAHGYRWGRRLEWADVLAYELVYTLPLGIQQSGIALILNSTQQADRVTKTIQQRLDSISSIEDLQNRIDFMIVLDNGRYEHLSYFDREASSGRPISPQVTIITRETLSEWLADP